MCGKSADWRPSEAQLTPRSSDNIKTHAAARTLKPMERVRSSVCLIMYEALSFSSIVVTVFTSMPTVIRLRSYRTVGRVRVRLSARLIYFFASFRDRL